MEMEHGEVSIFFKGGGGVKMTICKIFSAICKNFEKKKTTAKGVSVRVSLVLFFAIPSLLIIWCHLEMLGGIQEKPCCFQKRASGLLQI